MTKTDLPPNSLAADDRAPNSPECWMIIPAAGVGRRMGSPLPKQYLICQGKTLLEWTLAQCAQIESISRIWVAVNPEDEQIDEIETRFYQDSEVYHHKVGIMKTGDETRLLTVLNTLKMLQAPRHRLPQSPWVMVHDAVRPCLQPAQVVSLLAAAGPEGALLAYPVQDTVKRLGADHRVQQTLDRTDLWLAQTPQVADFDVLLKALNHAQSRAQDDDLPITDEASALEAIGLRPTVVLGSPDNCKLTRPEDLKWFQDYLAVNAPVC